MGGFKANAFTPPSHRHHDHQAKTSGEHQSSSSSKVQKLNASPVHQLKAVGIGRSLTQLTRKLAESIGSLRGDRLISLASQVFLGNHQPRVKWWRDAQGHDHYSVYDPHSQETHSFDTAQAVRVWLERRYYQ